MRETGTTVLPIDALRSVQNRKQAQALLDGSPELRRYLGMLASADSRVQSNTGTPIDERNVHEHASDLPLARAYQRWQSPKFDKRAVAEQNGNSEPKRTDGWKTPSEHQARAKVVIEYVHPYNKYDGEGGFSVRHKVRIGPKMVDLNDTERRVFDFYVTHQGGYWTDREIHDAAFDANEHKRISTDAVKKAKENLAKKTKIGEEHLIDIVPEGDSSPALSGIVKFNAITEQPHTDSQAGRHPLKQVRKQAGIVFRKAPHPIRG